MVVIDARNDAIQDVVELGVDEEIAVIRPMHAAIEIAKVGGWVGMARAVDETTIVRPTEETKRHAEKEEDERIDRDRMTGVGTMVVVFGLALPLGALHKVIVAWPANVAHLAVKVTVAG